VDSLENIYTVTAFNKDSNVMRWNLLKVFSSSGDLKDSIIFGVHKSISGVCVRNNELFVLVGGDTAFTFYDSVIVMSLDGAVKQSWPVPGGPEYISVNNSNDIYLTEKASIEIYDTLGNFKSSIAPSGFSPSSKVVFDSKGRIIVNQNESELWVFNMQGSLTARYDFSADGGNSGGQISAINIAGKNFIYIAILGFPTAKVVKILNMLP
jgi:hypothetical protein